MAKLNDIYITVESEEISYDVDVTEQPVESGINLTDHVRPKASTLSLSGVIVGLDAASKKQKILEWRKSGSMLKYVGRNLFAGVISSFSPSHTYDVANGFTFSMEIKEIRIAKTEYTSTLPVTVKVQVQKVKKAGRKQPKAKKVTKAKGKSIWEA